MNVENVIYFLHDSGPSVWNEMEKKHTHEEENVLRIEMLSCRKQILCKMLLAQ